MRYTQQQIAAKLGSVLFGTILCLMSSISFAAEIQAYQFPLFSTVFVNGDADVTLETKPQISVTAENIINPNFIQYRKQKLYINIPSKAAKYGRPKIIIQTPHLKTLWVQNGANINVNLALANLVVFANNNKDITLHGQAYALKTYLIQKGNGKTSIEWVNSDNIIAENSRSGIIQISGQTKNLNAKLSGQSLLNAMSLRADNITIQAEGTAKANIFPLKAITAHTKEKSNIYYFNRPKERNIDSQDNSNILLLKNGRADAKLYDTNHQPCNTDKLYAKP